jgi:hypothetical protein
VLCGTVLTAIFRGFVANGRNSCRAEAKSQAFREKIAKSFFAAEVPAGVCGRVQAGADSCVGVRED